MYFYSVRHKYHIAFVYSALNGVGCETFVGIASSVDRDTRIDEFEMYSTDMDSLQAVALSSVEMIVADDDEQSLNEVVDHTHFA